jgi:hypothetical protein
LNVLNWLPAGINAVTTRVYSDKGIMQAQTYETKKRSDKNKPRKKYRKCKQTSAIGISTMLLNY